MKYINETDFFYEIKISKGKGKLTKKAEDMMILIANEMIKKFQYVDYRNRYDCKQHGLLCMFLQWQKFDENRYDKAFPYFSELCKRGIAKCFTQIINDQKWYQKTPAIVINVNFGLIS